MLKKLQMPVLTKREEENYRQHYLRADITMARLGTMLFTIPLFGFIVNDYLLFGLSLEFYGLAVSRLCLLFGAVAIFSFLGKVRSYRTYEIVVSGAALAFLVTGGFINATRPENFLAHTIIAGVTVFVVYLVIPNRFINQILLASTASIGEVAIILIFVHPLGASTLASIILSLLLANIIAFANSWQLHAYRRKRFRDMTERKELQDKLQEYTRHLERLVEERTEKLKNAERLAAIGATAGMVGHDIRNPLTAITGAVYIAQKRLNLLPESETKASFKTTPDP